MNICHYRKNGVKGNENSQDIFRILVSNASIFHFILAPAFYDEKCLICPLLPLLKFPPTCTIP